MTIAWIFFTLYLVLTAALAWRGWSKTADFRSFALGGDLGPVVVGVTLAASIASTATFVINPGFVYANGLSALMHFGVAAPAGFLTALFLFAKPFRERGLKFNALTLPDWIGKRYESDSMRLYFAILNLLLSITFIVLIVKGSALIMQASLGLSYMGSLAFIVIFVFSYVLIGGTYAHAYTNTLQGMMMLVVAVLLIGKGIPYLFSGQLEVAMAAKDPELLHFINAKSPLFGNFFEVFVAAFIISLGLVCQPHILMKPLYLKSDSAIRSSLFVATLVSFFYAGVLLTGLWAHVDIPAIVRQDAVVATFVKTSFSPILSTFISVTLLAAGMSTLDGILIGVSTIAANDVAMNPMFQKTFGKYNEKQALGLSRWILIGVGIASFLVALDPPKLVGLFAQMGIYGLTAASLCPVLLGIFLDKVDSQKVFMASVLGASVHFVFYGYMTYYMGQIINPAVTASLGIAVSFLPFLPDVFNRVFVKTEGEKIYS